MNSPPTPIFAVRLQNISKVYGSFFANRDISLSIKKGSIHGLIGENGAGKSTLLKILFGIYQPTSGEIFINDQPRHWRSPLNAIQAGLGMVQQHFALVESLSALDNIMLGAEPIGPLGILNRTQALARIKSRIPSPTLAVDWQNCVENMTVGDRQRIEILKLLYRETDILCLDEPTAVLTPQETEDLINVLKLLRDQGKTILFVSHKIEEILSLCDEVTVLRKGQIVWTRPIAETNRKDLVTAMVGRELSEDEETRPPLNQTALSVLEFQQVADLKPGRDTLDGISFQLRSGEILGVAGVSGSGQRALIEMVIGIRKFNGRINCLGNDVNDLTTRELRELGIGIVPEERLGEGLWGNESIVHNLVIGIEKQFEKSWASFLGVFDEAQMQTNARARTSEYDVRFQSLDQPVESLSGGNQQKLIFAREIESRKLKILLCFNPSRGVDLGAIHLIHNKLRALRKAGVSVLYISHELEELTALSDRIMVLCEGKVTAMLEPSQFSRESIGHAMSGATAP